MNLGCRSTGWALNEHCVDDKMEIHLERGDGKLGDGCLRGAGHLGELGGDLWEQSLRISIIWD